MRLIRSLDRYDIFLLSGFTIALFVIFARPIRFLLDIAQQIEDTYGLALVPALLILVVVFLFQQQAKRQEIHAQVRAAAAEARQALDRARELELLVIFGQALARSLDFDFDVLREAVLRHLPGLIGAGDAWVLVRCQDGWQGLMGARRGGMPDSAHERIADRALAELNRENQPSGAVEIEDQVCIPMIAGGNIVGMMAVTKGPSAMTDSQRRLLDACAALLAIAVKNVQLFNEIRENSLHDGLTGCFNRAHGVDVLDCELRRARRTKSPLALILLDLDHFKTVNDQYGHLCGDMALAAVGQRIRESLRSSDVKCRYGGEEFMIMLPDTALGGAKRVAESLRLEVSQLALQWESKAVRLTASFGVTMARAGEMDGASIIARADEALYRAKSEGRNRVRLSPDNPADATDAGGVQPEVRVFALKAVSAKADVTA
jgi:diguanylate cyclase (GGDEF)-like protein